MDKRTATEEMGREPKRGRDGNEEKSLARSGEGSKTCGYSANPPFSPLLIDRVLDNVFLHIGLSNLPLSSSIEVFQNICLVCKQWRARATPLLEDLKESFITIKKVDSDGGDQPIESAMTDHLMKLEIRPRVLPVRRYKIESCVFYQRPQLLTNFLRICVPNTIELYLKIYAFRDLEYTAAALENLNLGKLKVLQISYQRYSSRREPAGIEFDNSPPPPNGGLPPLIELLIAASNLKSLHFLHDDVGCLAMLREICLRISSTDIIRVLGVEASDGLLDLDLQSLTDMHFKLKKCRLHLGLCSQRAICTFLAGQKETLQRLSLCCRGFQTEEESRSLFQELGQFQELETLKLYGFKLPPLSLAETFPKLAVVNFEGITSTQEWLEIFSSGEKCTSAHELHIPYYVPKGFPVVENMAKYFPNVKKVVISENGSTSYKCRKSLRDVFAYFTDIEELSISFPMDYIDDDYLLSGLSRDDVSDIADGDGEQSNFENVSLNDFPEYKPSIMRLTKLKPFLARLHVRIRRTCYDHGFFSALSLLKDEQFGETGVKLCWPIFKLRQNSKPPLH